MNQENKYAMVVKKKGDMHHEQIGFARPINVDERLRLAKLVLYYAFFKMNMLVKIKNYFHSRLIKSICTNIQ